MSNLIRTTLLSVIIAAAFLPSSALAERPVLPAVMTSQQPKIDGDISDQCWKDVPPITDFYYPKDGSRPVESTTAWICYDDTYVYIAFSCKDSQPNAIVAEQQKRGGGMATDDRVEINFDGWGNADWDNLMWFQVNPIGTQREVIQSGSASKIEWRGDWQAASKRTADGYTTEMAIPFSMLHYDPKHPNICVMLSRYHARTMQWWRTPNVGPNLDLRQFYQWQGVKAPNYQKKPTFLAYSLLGAGHANSSSTAGCDVKWDITPKLTGVATYRPDFGNVEQQVGSIDFTYNEVYYSDNRPFFSEGDVYLPGSNLFYTRRINDINYGTKLVGQVAGYNVGVLQGQEPGSDRFLAAKISRDLNGHGQIAFSGAQSRIGGTDSLASDVSGNYTLYEHGARHLFVASDLSVADAASGNGQGKSYSVSLNSDESNSLCWYVGHSVVDANYEPALGYVAEKDLRASTGGLSISRELGTGSVQSWDASLSLDHTDHLDGSKYHDGIQFNSDLSWRRGVSAWFGLSLSDRPPYKDKICTLSYSWGDRTLLRSGYVEVDFGDMASGNYLSYSFSQAKDLGNKLNLSLLYQNSGIRNAVVAENDYSSWQSVVTLSYDLDKQRTLAGRLVTMDGKSNVYVTCRQRVSSGTDIYLILGDPNAGSTESKVSVKFVRPI